jgi:hypothetical protein
MEKQSRLRADINTNTSTNTSILILPAELQISILHHLVPVLSQAQCHRVCRYVSYLSRLRALRSRGTLMRSGNDHLTFNLHFSIHLVLNLILNTRPYAGSGQRHDPEIRSPP